jgi:hypothetical protein
MQDPVDREQIPDRESGSQPDAGLAFATEQAAEGGKVGGTYERIRHPKAPRRAFDLFPDLFLYCVPDSG